MSSDSGWAISDSTVNWINNNLIHGSTILELGSGAGTVRLLENFKVLSIEENAGFVNLHKGAEYVHAPIVGDWYDTEAIREFLKDKKYDYILVDGPAYGKRTGFSENLDLFKTNITIMFDDTDRPEDWEDATAVSKTLNRGLLNPFHGFSVILQGF